MINELVYLLTIFSLSPFKVRPYLKFILDGLTP